MKINFSDRLNLIRGSANQADFAKVLGLSQPSTSELLKGNSLPRFEVLLRLCELGWNANWLLTGRGPMTISEAGTYPAIGGEVVAVAQKLVQYPELVETLTQAVHLQEQLQATTEQLKTKVHYPKGKKKA